MTRVALRAPGGATSEIIPVRTAHMGVRPMAGMHLGLGLGLSDETPSSGGSPPAASSLLLETGDDLLLETGDRLLLE